MDDSKQNLNMKQTVMDLLESRLTFLMKIKHSGIFVRNHFFWKKNYIALQVYYGEFKD